MKKLNIYIIIGLLLVGSISAGILGGLNRTDSSITLSSERDTAIKEEILRVTKETAPSTLELNAAKIVCDGKVCKSEVYYPNVIDDVWRVEDVGQDSDNLTATRDQWINERLSNWADALIKRNEDKEMREVGEGTITINKQR